jgi:chromosome segregation ATPase
MNSEQNTVSPSLEKLIIAINRANVEFGFDKNLGIADLINNCLDATTEANKRIAELESKLEMENKNITNISDRNISYAGQVEKLQASNNRLQAKLTAEKEYVNELLKSSNHLFVENEQLKASNYRLREALDNLIDQCLNNNISCKEALEALAFTPSQSLTEHDNELLERAAKAVDRARWLGTDVVLAIRALKTEVTK